MVKVGIDILNNFECPICNNNYDVLPDKYTCSNDNCKYKMCDNCFDNYI